MNLLNQNINVNKILSCAALSIFHLIFNYGWAIEDEKNFDNLTKAFAYWLNANSSENITVITKKDLFENYCDLSFVATHRILEDPNSLWAIGQIAQYNHNNYRKPVTYTEIPVDNFNKKERVPGEESFYFMVLQELENPFWGRF